MPLADVARGLRATADELEKHSTGGFMDPLGAVERVATAEELAAVARHDVRNRLASIRNATFYLKRRVEPTDLWKEDERIERFFAIIEEQVIRTTALLEEGLSLKHLFGRRIARTTGRACVERAVSCARVGTAPVVEIEGDAGQLDVDLSEVALAVRCLIENAAEAADSPAKVTAHAADGRLVVCVDDDGPGIPEADRETLFAPLQTRKDGHAGLGLSIARRIARRYHGDVTIEPAAAGASFALRLPLSAGEAP